MLPTRKTRGFTLIATLMLLLIMSGIAIGLLMMVNTEGKVGGQDNQNNLAFHAAEGGIEHMTSDLASMFQNIESPTASEIEALSSDAPVSSNLMSYPIYTLTPATNPQRKPRHQLGSNRQRNLPGSVRAGVAGHPASNRDYLPVWGGNSG